MPTITLLFLNHIFADQTLSRFNQTNNINALGLVQSLSMMMMRQ